MKAFLFLFIAKGNQMKAFLFLFIAVAISACSSIRGDKDIFYATNDAAGVKLGVDATGAPDILIGWTEQNLAIVPTGEVGETPLRAEVVGADGSSSTDALSVFGTFSGDLSGEAGGAAVVLERSFAVGQAASYMGDGWREYLKGRGQAGN